ncbi:MAG TPA: hypothetical protein VM688_05895 [Nocardioidaceae bacterium]|nr:hypothetical protein [Nocardioidaceae bacterium]
MGLPSPIPRSTRRIITLILTALLTFGGIAALGFVALHEHNHAAESRAALGHPIDALNNSQHDLTTSRARSATCGTP